MKEETKKSLLSIGYGNRKKVDFIKLIHDYNITYLIDIRTVPYSKYNPDFSQIQLKETLKSEKVTYIFMGDTIGGRPDDPSCYDENGKVLYDKLEETEKYQSGILRLVKAAELDANVTLMCSESDPLECHRTKLIGKSLLKKGISLNHITEKDKLKTQQELNLALTKGLAEVDLFGNSNVLTSKKSYV